jgi:hypothetical protein
VHVKDAETVYTVRASSENRTVCPLTDYKGLSLPGSAYFQEFVHPVCQAALRIRICGLVSIDKAVLEKIRQRAVAMISGLKGHSYEERLRELALTTLEERRHQTDMLQTFKILRGFDRVSSDTWFQRVDTFKRAYRAHRMETVGLA